MNLRFFSSKTTSFALGSISSLFFILLSCSKDEDVLDTLMVAPAEDTTIEILPSETPENQEPSTELRITRFLPVNDAYVQSGKGFDYDLMRLQENNRVAYLMFDLNPIAEIEGVIQSITFQFTLKETNGEGKIKISKGLSNDWNEASLSTNTAPEPGEELGTLEKAYLVGATEYIGLKDAIHSNEAHTLILEYVGSNELALASKEHQDKVGPNLIVTYKAALDAPQIVNTAYNENNPTVDETDAEVNNQEEEDEEESEEEETGEESNESENTEDNTEDNEAPKAIAEASVTQGTVPLQVGFDGSKSTDDETIASYVWDFADGGGSSNVNPTHTFNETGTYTVTLTVTDEKGLSNSASLTIVVSEPENEAPTAVSKADVTTGEVPLTVTFNGASSTDDSGITEYLWDFADGGGSSNVSPTHTFNEKGTYEVSLTVKDENGLTDTDNMTIVVEERPNEAPIANASSDITSGEAPLTVNFNGSQSTDDQEIVSYSWVFQDGSNSSEMNPTHTFQSPGTYMVEFTVTDAQGVTATDIDTIVVTAPQTNSGNHPPNAVFASSFGFQAGDASDAFRAAINSNHNYIVVDRQSNDWVIEPMKFFDLANKTIVFEPGVVLRAKSGAFSASNAILFLLIRPTNTTIEGYGAEFKMNKSEYTAGEGRHALGIYQANGLTVKGLTISDSGGDGIFLSGSNVVDSYSENVTIEDVTSTNNRRQGMSIVSAQDVWVRNSTFSGTSGTAPEAGVDLEPDLPEQRLVNINFENCHFKNNDSYGFMVAPGKLTSTSIPISVRLENCEFENNNLEPTGSFLKTELLLGGSTDGNDVKGSVEINNTLFKNSDHPVLFTRLAADSYTTQFEECSAINVNRLGIGSVINLEASSASDTLGGIDFGNFYLEYTSNTPFMRIRASNRKQLKDLQGYFTIKEPYDHDIEYVGGYQTSENINVNLNYQHIE